MGSFPYGPHGPEVSPTEVRPNPTKPSGPVPQFQEESYPSPSGYAGGGGGGAFGAIIANFLLSALFLLCVWEVFVCLYPLTALAGIAAGLATWPVLNRFVPPGTDVPAAAACIIGIVTGYIVIRVEYRLAQAHGYRIARHGVRLIFLAILAIPIVLIAQGAYVENSTSRYILSVLSNGRILSRFVANPANDLILLAVVIGLHFLLWNGTKIRRFWHKRLSAVGMK